MEIRNRYYVRKIALFHEIGRNRRRSFLDSECALDACIVDVRRAHTILPFVNDRLPTYFLRSNRPVLNESPMYAYGRAFDPPFTQSVFINEYPYRTNACRGIPTQAGWNVVCRLWKGYGSALFMELTDRVPCRTRKRRMPISSSATAGGSNVVLPSFAEAVTEPEG